jgi:hypothetical protein
MRAAIAGMRVALAAAAQVYRPLRGESFMDLHFVSSLTPEDEDRLAPALLTALGALLDQFAIAYTLRIHTTGAKVFQRHHQAPLPTEALTGRADRGLHSSPFDPHDRRLYPR